MKNAIIFLSLILHFYGIGWLAAATKTWSNGASGGVWTNGSNWGGTAPVAGDDLVINPTAPIVISGVPTLSISSLVIGGTTGNSVTLQSASTATLTITNGTLATDFSIASGITLVLDNFLTINATAASSSGIVDGELTVQGSGTFSTSASVTTFAAGSFYNHAKNGGSFPAATWNTSSTVNVTGITSSTPSGFSGSFGNLTWNNSSQTTSGSLTGALSLTGNLMIVAGKIAPATYKLSVAGNVTVTNPGILEVFGPTSTLELNGSAAQVISGNGTFSANSVAGRMSCLTINNSSGDIDLQTNLTITNSLTLSSGALGTTNGSTLTYGIGGGTLTMTRTGGSLTLTPSFSGLSGTTFNVIYGSGTAIPAITTGNEIPYSPDVVSGTFTVNNPANGVNLSGSITLMNGTLTLTSGPLSIGANVLSLAGNMTRTNGSLVGGPDSDINFYPGTPIISSGLYAVTNGIRNLTINRSGYSVLMWGDNTVNGILTLANGTLQLDDNAGTNAYTLTLNGTISSTGGFLGSMNTTVNTTLVIGGTSGGDAGTFGFALGKRYLKTLTVDRSGSTPSCSLSTPLSVTTLNLNSGIIVNNPTPLVEGTTNIITVTGTAINNITNTGGASSYVSGPLARALPVNLDTGSVYALPVGKSAYQLLELVNPETANLSGNAVIQAEVFDADCGGTGDTSIIYLRTDNYWSASVSAYTSNLISTGIIRLQDDAAPLGTGNLIGSSASVNGTYISIGGSVTAPKISSTVSPPLSLGYFVIGANGPVPAESWHRNQNSNMISIFSDPSGNFIHYRVTGESEGEILLKVFDIMGRQVKSKDERLSKGHQTKQLCTKEFNSGSYILQISNNNHQKFHKQFIIF